MKGLLLILGMCGLLAAGSAGLEQARNLYNLTAFDESLRVLQSMPVKDAPVYDLMGRDYYMQGDYKRSTEFLEKALAAEPGVAMHALWLGRAYGRRAESASIFTAPGFATKARQYLERAVELDPRNLDALADLFDYYVEAPGFLGGGMEKAQRTAAQLSLVSPAEGYLAEAKLAEKRNQYSAAETHLRKAVEVAPQQIGKLIEGDPAALRVNHAVIADHDEIDGQPGGGESGVEFADEGVHAERGGAGLARVGPELVAGVVGFGEVDGDEVRTVGSGQMEQRQRIVDARLLGLGRGLGFVVVGGVVRRQEAGDLGLARDPEKTSGAHALALG